MRKEEIARLRFRNQYVLAPRAIDCPFLNNSIHISGSSVLYTHVDLKVTRLNKGGVQLILLGDIFDYKYPYHKNERILEDIANADIHQSLRNLERYTGRFVIIFIINGSLYFAHDATATLKIFYSNFSDGLWCCSQSFLLAKVLGIKPSNDTSKTEFYGSERFRLLSNSNIGDTTLYDEIRQVKPNHFLDGNTCESIRFWPTEKISLMSVDDGALISANILKGYMESIASRYKVMLPVTAGKDSRTLLAATHDIRDKVYYYINMEKRLDETNKDIHVPKLLFKNLGLEYHILDPYIPMDKDFKKVYYQNNDFASDMYLPLIYNYYKHFSDRVNLPGNNATGASWYYPIYRRKIDVQLLMKLSKVEDYGHAIETYSGWLDKVKEPCNNTGYNLMDLFYWEERLGNWGTQIQLDKDIAQNDFNPYNSRLLIQTMLSVRPQYAIEFASYSLNQRINEILWPETLQLPINPTRKNKIFSVIESFGLLGMTYKLLYR